LLSFWAQLSKILRAWSRFVGSVRNADGSAYPCGLWRGLVIFATDTASSLAGYTKSGYQAEAGGLADPGGDAGVALLGGFQVLEVLLEGRFIELRQEIGRNRRVVPAYVLDELTFVHGGNTFQNGPIRVPNDWLPLTSVARRHLLEAVAVR
jgi:hypothetical protein